MNRKLFFVPFAVCAFALTSCGAKEISRDDAVNYVKENYKLTATPEYKSAKISWNFYDTNEDIAKLIFSSYIYSALEDTTTVYSVKGEGKVNATAAKACASMYLTFSNFESYFTETDWKFYQKDGLQAKRETETNGTILKYEMHYDTKGEITYNYQYMEGEFTTGYSGKFERTCTLTY